MSRASHACSASTTCSSVSCSRVASSPAVGGRPSSAPSSRFAVITRWARSCSSRGGRTPHVWSRKWRWTSPTIVGTAYELNAIPRSGS